MNERYGFTLIELMVTIALAAIVLVVGVPGFKAVVDKNRMAAATNGLVGALGLARSEAIKRGLRATVCKSADGATCVTTGDDWAQGWIVFADVDANGLYSTSEPLLRVHGMVGPGLAMVGNSNVKDRVSFAPSGHSVQMGTIAVCGERSGNVGNNLVINRTGRVRLDSGVSCP